ncbi:MAG TPA: hypothetical protein DEB70_09715 [Planctomycetaceae bacterium]|nr:hypothetical protein [Planctomycetaceae bacterium]
MPPIFTNADMDLKAVEGCFLSMHIHSLNSPIDSMTCLILGCDLAHTTLTDWASNTSHPTDFCVVSQASVALRMRLMAG